MARQVKRISELPEAAVLTGDELLEIVQDGGNKRVKLDDLPGGGDVSISKVADNRLERKPDGLYVRDRLDPDPVAYYLLSRG